MKLIFKIVIITFIVNNAFSQSGWFIQNSSTSESLFSLSFADENTGWCVGNKGVILKTTNGGNNWIQQFSGFQNNLRSSAFVSDNIGYIVGDSGTILKTTNSGNTWNYSDFPNYNYNFKSVFFVNDNIGFIGGESYVYNGLNKIYKTSNQGKTWDSLPSMSDFVKVIYFVNPNIGWIINITGTLGTEFIYKTTNGGIDWFYQFNILNVHSIFFINQTTGWTSGYGSGPTIYKSTNGGNNWIPCLFCDLSPSHSLYFVDSIKGWGAGFGQINHTINAGTIWSTQTTNHPFIQYNSIYFSNSLTGWTAGDSGVILKTTNGGVLTNFSNNAAELPVRFFLSQNHPNPFNPRTIINYELGITNYVKLIVFDVLGNEVATLVNENKPVGSYKVEFDGSEFASGIYFYRLEVDGNHIDTKRMILLK